MVVPPHVNLLPLGVAHYYGDTIRQIFVAAAALMLIGAPFYADNLKSELPFVVGGALVLIALAAVTNPHSKNVAAANAIAAGVGLLIYEIWALYEYDTVYSSAFLLRELLAIMFLAAFYYSMKTLRAFILHQVGKEEEVGEFDEQPHKEEPNPEELQRMHDEEDNVVHVKNEGDSEHNHEKKTQHHDGMNSGLL